MEKREFQRVPFQSHCEISCGERCFNGELLDISLRGALFRILDGTDLEIGRNCTLVIQLGEGGMDLRFDSQLVHLEEDHYGFLFLSEDLDTLTHLRRLLELNLGDDELIKREMATWLKGGS